MKSRQSPFDPFSIQAENLGGLDGIFHGFHNRHGGCSPAPFHSFNCNAKPPGERIHVIDNLTCLQGIVPNRSSALVLLNQIHSANIITIGVERQLERINLLYAEGDALITKRNDLIIGVFSADCVPVLISDLDCSVIAAVHSGWRGTVKRISTKTVETLEKSYGIVPDRLVAAIGPSIGPDCYRVGIEVIERFRDYPECFKEATNGYYLDLKGIIRRDLGHAGLLPESIVTIDTCNHCHGEDYFSYRRDGGPVGCQLSYIGRL